MEAKKVAATGFIVAAAGAGAYFLFSKRFAPTRKAWADKLRSNAKMVADETATVVGQTRKNVKAALGDVSEITAKAADKL
jgi:hypothetical protein